MCGHIVADAAVFASIHQLLNITGARWQRNDLISNNWRVLRRGVLSITGAC